MTVCSGFFYFLFINKSDLQWAMGVCGSGWWVAAVLWWFFGVFDMEFVLGL